MSNLSYTAGAVTAGTPVVLDVNPRTRSHQIICDSLNYTVETLGQPTATETPEWSLKPDLGVTGIVIDERALVQIRITATAGTVNYTYAPRS